jgi:hypothetical protein
MCSHARLSSDVSEIKLVFSIPPHRPAPNIAPSWNVAPTDLGHSSSGPEHAKWSPVLREFLAPLVAQLN